jgi:hypothetical protein
MRQQFLPPVGKTFLNQTPEPADKSNHFNASSLAWRLHYVMADEVAQQ